MNFSNYTRVQLGLPPASADAGMAAVRRARVMQMNGFGAMAISEVTGQPCSAGDYGNNWEGYCDCLFKKGSGPMQVCCGKENLNADGSCGKPRGNFFQGNYTGFINAPWTLLGKGERGLKASGLGQQVIDQFNNVVSGSGGGGTTPGGGGGGDTGGGGTDTGSGGMEEKKDNTMLILGVGVVAIAVLALSMRK